MKITRTMYVIAAASIAAVAWACQSPDRPAPAVRISDELAALSKIAKPNGRQPSAHVRRVADVHNRALLRFFGNLDSYIGPKGHRTAASRCAGLQRLTREVIQESNQNAGLPANPQLEQSIAVDAVHKARPACGGPVQAALFVPRFRPFSDEDVVTPSAAPHLQALMNGYNNMSDPFSGSIGAVNNGVLSAASNETQANYDAIYMTTQFAFDDAALWVSFGDQLGDDAFCDPDVNPDQCADPPDEMTLFAPKNVWVMRALLGVLSDLAGCIGSEVADAHAGNVSERDMYAHCAAYGAGTSGSFALSLLGATTESEIRAAIIRMK